MHNYAKECVKDQCNQKIISAVYFLERNELKKAQEALSNVLCEYLPGLCLTSTVQLNDNDGEMLIFSGASITGILRFYSKESIFSLNIDATSSYEEYSKKNF